MNYPIGRDAPITLKLSAGVMAVELELWADVVRGAFMRRGMLKVRRPRGTWRKVLGGKDRVLVLFDPSVGVVGGSTRCHEPELDRSSKYQARLCSSEALRFHVSKKWTQWRLMGRVGRIVRRKLFPKPRGDFVFNTVACVGAPDDRNLGTYTNPNSPWFNVFFGYYEIDVSAEEWGRPFGYRNDAGIDSEVEFEDVVRLGKADWNWFSNWMYGVPKRCLRQYTEVDMSKVTFAEASGAHPVSGEEIRSVFDCKGRLWHFLTLNGVEVASSYESDAHDADKLVKNSPMWRAWRDSFGLPNPQRGKDVSFIPTTMHAQFYMAYQRNGNTFQTLMFGATVLVDEQGKWVQPFLDEQLRALEQVIEKHYWKFGFSLPPGAVDLAVPAPPTPAGRFTRRALASSGAGARQSSGG
jgi:hypothetical protein